MVLDQVTKSSNAKALLGSFCLNDPAGRCITTDQHNEWSVVWSLRPNLKASDTNVHGGSGNADGWVRWKARNWGESVDYVQSNDGPLSAGEVQADF